MGGAWTTRLLYLILPPIVAVIAWLIEERRG